MIDGNKAGLVEMHQAYLKGQDLKVVYRNIVAECYFYFNAYGDGKIWGAKEYLRKWLDSDMDMGEYCSICLRCWDKWATHMVNKKEPTG
jgi:hypothetical protein